MTKVHFYHGVADRIAAVASLLTKAGVQQKAVVVYAPDAEVADRLDRFLWAQPALSFTPHCRADSPLAAETPIIIANELASVGQDQRLINLSNELPPGFARFENLVEVVSVDDADRLPARERFKFYRERGYEIQSHELK